MNINRSIFGGNIGTVLELNTTDSGREVLNFRVASNERYKNARGDRVERTTWAPLVAWGQTAVNIAKYFKKGDPIVVEARLQENRWTDRDTGKARSRLELVVDRFHFTATARAATAPVATDEGPDLPFEDASGDSDDKVPV